MGYASESVALGHCPSVRRHLTTGLTVASAGVLAVGLVLAPPDVRGARTEVRQVQLTTLALSPPALLGALEKLIGTRAAKAAAGGAADIPAAVVKTPTAGESTPPTFGAATDPATNPHSVDVAALAPTTTALEIPAPLLAAIPEPILAIVGIALLFGPIILLVILACPPCALFNFLTFTIPSLFIPFAPLSAVAEVSTASVEASATNAPTLAGDPELSDSAPPPVPPAGAANGARPAKAGKPDASPHVTSTEPATGNEELSTDTVTSTTDVTETAKADEESTVRAAGSAPRLSANDSAPEATKPTVRRATPRSVVRGSLGVGEQLRGLPHRGKGGHRNTETGDGAATAGPSSAADNSSTGGDSSGAASPGGAPDDS
jgi:hypothetical protein